MPSHEDLLGSYDLLNELQMCKDQIFHLHFLVAFHNLLPCYHMGMGGKLPFPFSTAAIQNSPLFSRAWTPTSAILEGERTYSLFEEVEIIRQELLHLLSPTYSNISPPSILTTFILKGTVLSKGEHLCPWSGPFPSPLTSWPVNYPFTYLFSSLPLHWFPTFVPKIR